MELTLLETIITGLFGILAVIITATIMIMAKKTPPTKRLKKTLYSAIIVNILLIIAFSAIAIVPNTATNADQKTIIKIAYPLNGAAVDQNEVVQGISQNIPSGTKLWVVVHIPNLGLYYPMAQPASMLSNGNWTSSATLGRSQDYGQFNVEVVTVDQAAESAFLRYIADGTQSGMSQLPEGTTTYDIVVTNRQQLG